MKPSRALSLSAYVVASRNAAKWAKAKLRELEDRAADPADASPAIFDLFFWLSCLLGVIGIALICKYGWALQFIFTNH